MVSHMSKRMGSSVRASHHEIRVQTAMNLAYLIGKILGEYDEEWLFMLRDDRLVIFGPSGKDPNGLQLFAPK